MDKRELIERLMATFVAELEEHVSALNRDLLAVEEAASGERAEIIKTLFRTVHSLKGAARSVSVQPIEAACHHLETILAAVRDGVRPFSPAIVQLLFDAADALKDAGERLREHQELAGAPIDALRLQLEAVARGSAAESVARQDPPPAPPTTPPTLPPSTPERPALPGMTRVSAEKLDALVARGGELLVARRRSASRHEDVEQLHDLVQGCRAEWVRFEDPLRKLLKNGTNGSAAPGGPRGRAKAAPAPLLPRRAMLALDRTRESLKKIERATQLLASQMVADSRLLDQAAAPLEDDIRRARMLPFSEACEGLDRAVRDLAHSSGKQVALVVRGGDVEIDRAVLEALKDPLLHLVRNAVDHGLERPEAREAQGKPPRGTIAVAATLKGGNVEVAVADDGSGLSLDAIREQAQRRGLAVPDDDEAVAKLIFLPGFSTVKLITELSGRGVGLDVVKHRIQALHGHVEVTFTPGRGTRAALVVPLTLTMIRGLLLTAGGQTFALPVANIRRLVRAGREQLRSIEGREVLVGADSPIPVVRLTEILGLDGATPAGDRVPLVVVAVGARQVAFAVDELLAEQELIAKNLGARLLLVRNFAGATILPTGAVCLILNASDLVERAIGHKPGRPVAPPDEARAEPVRKRVLIADDSVTTRSLEKNIIEAAGFDVAVAADGVEAWQLLQEHGADVVVSDVEMPGMDGFALCEAIRSSKRLRDTPVILVTALESEKDKARGLAAGADAYLPKSAFDQRQLLATIAQLV